MPRAVNPPSDARTQPAGLEPGSFRDPESRVFYAGDEVFRALSPDGLSDFEALRAAGLLDDPRIVAHRAGRGRPGARRGPARPRARRRCCATSASRSSRIPTSGRSRCSRTPRWSSSTSCWPRSITTSSSRTPRPTTCSSRARGRCSSTSGSFERLREGEAWVGYRQFCMLYLYPLLLQAVKDVPFHPWLRGSIDGITPLADAQPDVLPRPLPQGPVHQRLPARPARGALRRPARPGQAGGQARLQEGAVRRQRAQDAQARRAALRGTRRRASGPPTASATATPTTTRAARTSSSARSPRRSPGTSSGTSAPTTAATRASPPRAPRR